MGKDGISSTTWALEIARGTVDGTLFSQMLSVITTDGADRADLVFGLVLLGMVCGAGLWIGWELARTLWQLLGQFIGIRPNAANRPGPFTKARHERLSTHGTDGSAAEPL